MEFDYEPAEQDGFSFRAIEVWPEGHEPDRSRPAVTGASDAYRPSLTVTSDQPDEPDRA